MCIALSNHQRGSASTLAVLMCVGAAFATSHFIMEHVSRFAEVNLGAYLWWQEEYHQIFTATNYIGRGSDRLMLAGPSESREGFVPERLEERLPEFQAYQHSQSVGTMEDGLVVLEYIEKAYGPSAIPRALLLGITTRFIANIRGRPSPLFRAIDRYSSEFRLDESTHPPTLVRKSFWESCRAWFAFTCRQQQRYRSAIRAVVRDWLIQWRPALADNEWLGRSLSPAKYRHLKPRPIEETKKWLAKPGGIQETIRTWNATEHQDRITSEMAWLLDFVQRYDIELYVVNMPELSWNRRLYPPGIYVAYLEAVTQALGETPFLDLRTFLTDDEFYDSCHPTLAGSIRLSDRIADFIADRREQGGRLSP